MGLLIEDVAVIRGGWRNRHSALRLAVSAAETCLHRAGRHPDDVDLLINTGIYRDHNLAEPALAALIQHDVGANPEDPHESGHGTFSFDVANGSCGALTALQIVDGFLRSQTIDCALVVTSDADPGRRCSDHFPFSPVGAALLCHWRDNQSGLGRVHWANGPDDGDTLRATVGLEDSRNVLRITTSDHIDERFAAAGADVARRCLREASLEPSDVDVVVAAPARAAFRATLASLLRLPPDRIVVADDDRMHTAALFAAFRDAGARLPADGRVLLVAAGAGVTAGAALYRMSDDRSQEPAN